MAPDGACLRRDRLAGIQGRDKTGRDDRLRARALVFGLRSIALPGHPGTRLRDLLGYYVQMWDWHSVVPMAMLFRTPLAPLVIGGTLDLFGGWGLLVVMALLFAASVVLWTRTALTFGPRAALVTAVALLVYPGYGILFHTPGERARGRGRVRRVGAGALARVDPPGRRTVRHPRRGDCGHRVGSPCVRSARARSRRCRSSFASPGARGSDAWSPAPASPSRCWARGRS